MPDEDANAPRIPTSELSFQRFKETRDVESFDCGNKDLNEFLCTDQVRKYEDEGFGFTYLVYWKGRLVVYLTVCADSLRVEYLQKHKSFSRFHEMRMETIPSLKIGRLATDQRYDGRGVGTACLRYAVGMVKSNAVAARLIILQAEPGSEDWYLSRGLQFVFETRNEKKRVKKTMFLDVQAV